MPFTEEDKHLIKVLREEKRYSSRQLLAEFPTKNWSRGGLDYLLKKIDVSGSIARTAGSGRRRSARRAVKEGNDRLHFTRSVATKFPRSESRGLQHLGNTPRKSVQLTHC